MNLAELKLELIARIIATDNYVLLQKIGALLNNKNYSELEENPNSAKESVMKYQSVRVFTEEEQRKINIAVQQYENGECISDEEAQKEIQAWLED